VGGGHHSPPPHKYPEIHIASLRSLVPAFPGCFALSHTKLEFCQFVNMWNLENKRKHLFGLDP